MENKEKMKAIVIKKYGSPDVLELKEVDKPLPKDNEVLIKNYGSSINTVDVLHRGGKAPSVAFFGVGRLIGLGLRLSFGGIRKPKQKISGGSYAGEIVSLGKDVTDWKVGDQVYGYHEAACAEFMTAPASLLALKPKNLNFHEAAAVPGGSTPALLAFKDLATPENGQKVLVIGASGGIGTFGVQIAKIYGAVVTGVCGPTNVDMVKNIGADFVIDYTKEDYTKSDKKYDIIFDAVAVTTLSKVKKILVDKGIYVLNNPINSPKSIFHLMTNGLRKKKIKTGTANEAPESMNLLREWIESGKIKPVIDTVYPLDQTAEAHRHYETGHSKGRVVISIE